MRRVVYSDVAKRSLADMFEYIAREAGSATPAHRFVKQVRAQCSKLAGLPTILGRPRPDLEPDLRRVPFRNYVIYFRYGGDKIRQVVDILEGHRDPASRFRG